MHARQEHDELNSEKCEYALWHICAIVEIGTRIWHTAYMKERTRVQ